MILSIIICTYNRAAILDICLKCAVADLADRKDVEILVIDNASTDHTVEVVAKFTKYCNSIKYIQEEAIGLSNARNTGARRATSNWLLYIDDDTKLRKGNIEMVIDTIENFDFAMFTGIYEAWHKGSPPKWLPESTGTYRLRGSVEIREIGEDYVTGLVMAMKKDTLAQVGMFPTELGMKGDQVAYGEESYVEAQMKVNGFRVGINPNLVVDHLVGAHKYQLSWHLSAAYQKGVSNIAIDASQSKVAVFISLMSFILVGWIRPGIKMVVDKSFYWQNFVIRYWGSILYHIGQLRAGIL